MSLTRSTQSSLCSSVDVKMRSNLTSPVDRLISSDPDENATTSHPRRPRFFSIEYRWMGIGSHSSTSKLIIMFWIASAVSLVADDVRAMRLDERFLRSRVCPTRSSLSEDDGEKSLIVLENDLDSSRKAGDPASVLYPFLCNGRATGER
ncbi:hypothetical protein OGAPHI_001461 [Ogataea philodendri]|uniref:Uncharacterized protein n=1 Tax=Ogataea philodendri TaxID=1378263 RepID=A0A9P8PD05_9ASCO|nr:uncharacterized protein OGAPHI_001461 [Ogataea philodendri]KAH3669340.1 hypothetical protein OGAPHI_001461 [Ogataea philodendri]